jgi:hypothetical protein
VPALLSEWITTSVSSMSTGAVAALKWIDEVLAGSSEA